MIDDSFELNSNEHDKQIFKFYPFKKTNFFVSFCYLIFQVLIPGLVLFFLTSRDFSFSFKLSVWWMVASSIFLILFAIISTFITYKFKLHQLDQFTYVISFVSFISGLYLTSYWLDYHYFLIRFVISFVVAIIGVFFASVSLLLVFHKKMKKYT